MDESFAYLSATEIAALVRDRKATAAQIVDEQIARIKRLDPDLASIAILMEGQARKDAAALDEETARGASRGPLHGVPMTVKEQFWIKGTKSTLNSAMYRNWVASEDAELVRRLRRAGAVILGKSNVAKNLMDSQILGDLYPEGKNPYDPAYTPGGSSGGAAAALAAGFSALELGGDLAGSIRLPAAYCGVYGLKPTENTLPSHGGASMPLPLHMASAGPMARGPEDIDILWKALRGPFPGDRRVAPVEWKAAPKRAEDFRVAWTDGWAGYPASAETAREIEAFVGRLAATGVKAAKASPAGDLHRRTLALYFKLLPMSLFYDSPWIVRKIAGAGLAKGNPFARELGAGFRFGIKNYSAILKERDGIVAEWEGFLGGYDLLICPAGYSNACKRHPSKAPVDYGGKSISDFEDIFPFLAVFNASGNPAMAIPMATGANGLPLGAQIVGSYWSEPTLIEFAKLASSIAGFKRPARP